MLKRWRLWCSYPAALLLLPLLPLIIRQGKHTRTNTLRLPEASGPRQGHCLSPTQQAQAATPERQLLHIGESTVAGVGVRDTGEGLTAHIIRHWQQLGISSQWQIIAQTGINAAQLQQQLQQHLSQPNPALAPCTHLLVTLGVNDTTGFTRRRQWRQQLLALVQPLQRDNPSLQVAFTQVPPMQRFPALPRPLNYLLGLRAWQLDQELQHLCAEQGWRHLQLDMPLQPEWMASDGYHPNLAGYRLWGEGIARLLSQPQ